MRTSTAIAVGYQLGLFGFAALSVLATMIAQEVLPLSASQQALEEERADDCPRIPDLCETDDGLLLATIQRYGFWTWLIAMGPSAAVLLHRSMESLGTWLAAIVVFTYRKVRRIPVVPGGSR